MQVTPYIRTKLIENGFSEGEALTFVKLLVFPEATTAFLKNQTKLSLAGTYKVLDSLVNKGLVVPIPGKPTKYQAADMNQLAQKFERESRKMKRVAEKLKGLNDLVASPYPTEIYEDDDLVNQYLTIPGQIDDFIWCVGSFEAVVNFFGENIEKEFINKRCKNGVFADAIIFDNSEHSKSLAGRDKGEKRETKFIEVNNYPLDFDYLFGDTYLNFHKDSEGKLRMIKAESPDLAKAKLLQYQIMWNSTLK
ncbi:hypothetical protein HOM98_03845 [Candidatus Peregrinibacteria bacterium]|jgi:sugar-specific transcriptional regulator TrmB|nr:hypothetical protein [Candidatus Peregrinibacteria bacterium]MBT7484514.1 hypothetical protein [Candidatus Peregrinibacteria bacterium]